MSRCEAPAVLRSEAYIAVRCNDEGQGERRRWVFFSSLSKVPPLLLAQELDSTELAAHGADLFIPRPPALAKFP